MAVIFIVTSTVSFLILYFVSFRSLSVLLEVYHFYWSFHFCFIDFFLLFPISLWFLLLFLLFPSFTRFWFILLSFCFLRWEFSYIPHILLYSILIFIQLYVFLKISLETSPFSYRLFRSVFLVSEYLEIFLLSVVD